MLCDIYELGFYNEEACGVVTSLYKCPEEAQVWTAKQSSYTKK